MACREEIIPGQEEEKPSEEQETPPSPVGCPDGAVDLGHSQDIVCEYAWRVIDDKQMTGYNWPSYKWRNGNYNKLTKYCPETETSLRTGTGAPDLLSPATFPVSG